MTTSAAPKILVVDDDPRILASVRRMAQDLNVDLTLVDSAEAAWAVVERERPALILCDWRLPGLDGLTFLERVHARWPEVRRVLHTGEPLHRVAYGVDVPVLAKPCAPEILRELFLSLDGSAPLKS